MPKPSAIHDLHGNPGKRKRKTGEPTVTGTAPNPPTYLTAHAKRLWRELLSEFGDIQLVTPPDRYTFGMFVQALARVIEAEKILTIKGLIVEEPVINRHGNDTGRVKVKPHPAVGVAKMYSALANQIGARFGLSPADRARVIVPKPLEDEDEEWSPNTGNALTEYLGGNPTWKQ